MPDAGDKAVKLYVIPGSNPSLTTRLMLERKGIPYDRVDLLPVISKGVLRAAGFPGVTVPAMKLPDGRRVQGSLEISKALEELSPEPPLYPSDPAERAKVEEAERWAEQVPQERARRVIWWALKRDRSPMTSFSEGSKLPVPAGLAVRTAGPIVAISGRINGSTDEGVRIALTGLPEVLDHADALIAAGVLGGDEPNAADYQLAPSLRLLMSMDDLRPAIEPRPCGQLALRVCPDFPGKIPPVFPAEWLEPLRSATQA